MRNQESIAEALQLVLEPAPPGPVELMSQKDKAVYSGAEYGKAMVGVVPTFLGKLEGTRFVNDIYLFLSLSDACSVLQYGYSYTLEVGLQLHHMGRSPRGAIAPVTYVWRPESKVGEERRMWLWVHAAAFEEALACLQILCQSQVLSTFSDRVA